MSRNYNGGQWTRIERWVRENAQLIGKYGFRRAETAAKGRDMDPDIKHEGWTVLWGISPSADQIESVVRTYGIKLDDKGRE